MSQASRRKTPVAAAPREQLRRRVREAGVIVLASAALFVALALFSYHSDDPGWSQGVSTIGVRNGGGLVGAYVADILLYFLGYPGYLFPLALLFDGLRLFRRRCDVPAVNPLSFAFPGIVRFAGFVLSFAGACTLAALQFKSSPQLPALGEQLGNAGGVLGMALGAVMHPPFGASGSVLSALAMLLAGVTLYTGLSWLRLMESVGRLVTRFFEKSMNYINVIRDVIRSEHARKERRSIVKKEQVKRKGRPPPRIDPVAGRLEVSERAEREKQKKLFDTSPQDASLPPLDLLDAPQPQPDNYSRETLEAMSRQVELKLQDFNIQAEVVSVNPGPVITRFELQPAPGVKGSQISNLARDLARSLSVVSVRVVDVIPGKSVVGLEIPNASRETVYLGEILSSREYEAQASSTVLALGKDISGRPVVMDLARMPHLLAAGTTGSGKSVAINAMILSLLYKATPRETRLIMVDPKMLELSVYEGIPHLLTPVVTDMKEAANALRWCVAEMERRYRLMAALGVRQINGYNRKVKEAAARGEPLLDPGWTPGAADEPAPELEALPSIVVIIDELADMMMTVGKKVEELIARLAQKARAAGIHLILATQRPSVDVITGLIKANIPCRIAFQVSGRVDSRIILDQQGAENLLGHGDMLFLPPGAGNPVRVHGAFVDDHEVHKVVKDIKSRGEPSYLDDIVKGPEEGGAPSPTGLETEGEGGDELYEKAVRVVMEERKASISYIQRRLRIGYNRAARFIEQMEAEGLVGPLEANGSREIRAAPAASAE